MDPSTDPLSQIVEQRSEAESKARLEARYAEIRARRQAPRDAAIQAWKAKMPGNLPPDEDYDYAAMFDDGNVPEPRVSPEVTAPGGDLPAQGEFGTAPPAAPEPVFLPNKYYRGKLTGHRAMGDGGWGRSGYNINNGKIELTNPVARIAQRGGELFATSVADAFYNAGVLAAVPVDFATEAAKKGVEKVGEVVSDVLLPEPRVPPISAFAADFEAAQDAGKTESWYTQPLDTALANMLDRWEAPRPEIGSTELYGAGEEMAASAIALVGDFYLGSKMAGAETVAIDAPKLEKFTRFMMDNLKTGAYGEYLFSGIDDTGGNFSTLLRAMGFDNTVTQAMDTFGVEDPAARVALNTLEGMILASVFPLAKIAKDVVLQDAVLERVAVINERLRSMDLVGPVGPAGQRGAVGNLTDNPRPRPAPAAEATSFIVSTRVPTAVKATEDPLAGQLNIGLEAMRADPKTLEKNATAVSQYSNFKPVEGTPDQVAEAFIDDVADNLTWLYDQTDPAIRERSRKWYEGANKVTNDWTKEYPQYKQPQLAGAAAALSPQKDWFQNADLARRTLDIVSTQGKKKPTKAMMETAGRIFAKPQYQDMLTAISKKPLSKMTDAEAAMYVRLFDETYNPRGFKILSPEGEFGDVVRTKSGAERSVAWGSLDEIAKAVSILRDGSRENISRQLGGQHKVRNFYNNILDPNNEQGFTTIDTHAVAAGLLRPLSGNSMEVAQNFGGRGSASSSITGSRGTYGLYDEAYRRAAKARGVLPREMQSITWESIRGLWSPEQKRDKRLIAAVESVWENYRNGTLDKNQARQQILELSGGINAPEWAR